MTKGDPVNQHWLGLRWSAWVGLADAGSAPLAPRLNRVRCRGRGQRGLIYIGTTGRTLSDGQDSVTATTTANEQLVSSNGAAVTWTAAVATPTPTSRALPALKLGRHSLVQS